MGKKSQSKGRGGELELSRLLQGYGYPVEPGHALNYGKEPDLSGLPGIHIECKRAEQLRISEWVTQARQPDRSGKRPETFLKGFTGCLVTDGYAGYNQVTTAIHCGCWAHARRKWREAMPDGATVKTSKAAVGYNYCTKLFSAEKKCVYADAKARQAHRQNVDLPLLEEYFCWLKTIHPEKGSKLEDAVRYSLNQKQQLMEFLDHWDVPISNNLAENAIRPFVVGRKNWLFCDSVKGAESSAIVYSLVETAKANKIDPYDYLLLVLSLLPYLGKDPAHEMLDTLMPWHPDVKYRELRMLDNE